jgi:hypothetical protein
VKLRIQELRPAVSTNDYSSQLTALKAAIEKSNSSYHDFVGNLTKAQQAGLKKQIQNSANQRRVGQSSSERKSRTWAGEKRRKKHG